MGDYLAVRISTYGDRRHEKLGPEQKLAGIIAETAAKVAPFLAAGIRRRPSFSL